MGLGLVAAHPEAWGRFPEWGCPDLRWWNWLHKSKQPGLELDRWGRGVRIWLKCWILASTPPMARPPKGLPVPCLVLPSSTLPCPLNGTLSASLGHTYLLLDIAQRGPYTHVCWTPLCWKWCKHVLWYVHDTFLAGTKDLSSRLRGSGCY